MHILSPVTDSCLSWISGRKNKNLRPDRVLNTIPVALESDGVPTFRLAINCRVIIHCLEHNATDTHDYTYKWSTNKELFRSTSLQQIVTLQNAEIYFVSSKFFHDLARTLIIPWGWSGGATVLGKLPVSGRPTYLDYRRARAYFAYSRCGWGCLNIFTLIYPSLPLSHSLWETARYRLKYCLKGPLKQNQPTNQW